jgi:hypothetical protein
MKKVVLTIIVLIFISITAEFAFTYSASAPPAAHANDPGNGNCTNCHTSFPLATSGSIWNSIDLSSSVALSQFLPSTVYTLDLSFSDPVNIKYGFELVALPSGANASSASVGAFTATSSQTELQTQGAREYMSHSSTGTSAPGNTKTWSFDWETPASFSGDVDFYVVVNSTNSDGSNSGDQIYAKVFSTTILPVKWLSYEVKTDKAGNHILWTTASELNNDRFDIEKSSNGTDWQLAGTVKAKGNSSQQTKYTYFDATSTSSKTYYRIKQVDVDGRFEYSKTLFSQSQSEQIENVSYDPLTSKINISNPSLMAPAMLFNLAGTAVCEDIYGETLNVGSIEKGIYVLKLPSGNYQKIYIY